uniref:Uncharacterized protein n=1 Tax=Avena sativa TaxID=4498 RepID=A0ACD5TPJ8_AVESA
MLHGGCVLYMWDMVSGSIHVLDPLSGLQGPTPRKLSLKFVSAGLHDTLFNCLNEYFAGLNEYFAGWPKKLDNWGIIYLNIVDTKFTRVESGLSILHLLRYYDDERLKFPIKKNNLDETRLDTLHEIMKLHDNHSPLPVDVMWDALAPSQYIFRDFLN